MNNKELINDLSKSINSVFKYISNDIKYIRMDNGKIKVLTSIDNLHSDRNILLNVPRRNRMRLLKQGYIIYIG